MGICTYANCCVVASGKDNLRVICEAKRVHGNASAPNTWPGFQEEAWTDAISEAFDCITSQCPEPIDVRTNRGVLRFKNECPATYNFQTPPELGKILHDRGLAGNAYRWATATQVGGFSRPLETCNPSGQFPGDLCNGLFTWVTYDIGVTIIHKQIIPGSTLAQAYGIHRIRFYVTVNYIESTSNTTAMKYVESLNVDAYCIGRTPAQPVCEEADMTVDPMQSVYGTLPFPGPAGTQNDLARRIKLWKELSSDRPIQAMEFTPDLTQNQTVFYETDEPCHYIADDDYWYFAVTPSPLCFDEVGLDDTPPGSVNCNISSLGCTQGFSACGVSRFQLKKFAFGHVSKFELLDAAGNIVETITT